MLITRIDSDRDMEKEVTRITLKVGDHEYRLKEHRDGLEINKYDLDDDQISVMPKVANAIVLR